jgi:serine/threonine-protein kinase
MGSVYKGVDLMLEREVAIKALRPELARQPDIVERFRAEAVTLAKLNHPHIATLFSFLRQGDDFFMVMEFVRGETLDSVLRRSGGMPVERAVPMFCQALEGIDHAHRLGIIHRDIKPANMMLTQAGSIKVMDFGIARVLGTARMTRQGNVIGTVEYMSPEQVRGQETDARSDIYSLGILLYEMLTGRVPFRSDSEYELMRSQCDDAPPPPRDFSAHIPVPIEQSIMRALAKDPARRFQTASDLRAALLGGSAGAYAASSADTLPLPAVVTSPDMPAKETRMAGVQTVKETRLPSEAGFNPGVAQQASWPVAPAASPQQPASLFARLSWKHYSAAAVVLLLLLAVPFVLLVVLGNQTTPPAQPKKVTQPQTQTAPVEAPPQSLSPGGPAGSADSGSNPLLAPTPGPALGSPPVLGPQPGDASGANKTKSARTAAPPKKDNAAADAAAAAAREKARRREAAERALDK